MSRFIDETGKHYGFLTVIKKSDKTDSKHQIYWDCQCECGKITTVRGTCLRSGQTTSCGCKRNLSKQKDELGKRYGHLTVIAQSPERVNKHIAWICKCDCGNICTVSGSLLRSGSKTQCTECSNRSLVFDETGHKYGDLTVISYEGQSKNRNALWNCQCSCGNYIVVSGKELRDGKKFNCGCKRIYSQGAEQIKSLLIKNNILFEQEKTFDSCRFPDTNALARFDFYLPTLNRIIEYDGEQHFFSRNSGWDTQDHLNYTQAHDQYKNQWCKEHGIDMVRIPYYQKIQIENLLL